MVWVSRRKISPACSHTASRLAWTGTASVCIAGRSPLRNSAARYELRATARDVVQHSFSSCRSALRRLSMANSSPLANRRILIIDDNAAIHLDFRKVLGAQSEHSAQDALDVLEANLFGEAVVAAPRP